MDGVTPNILALHGVLVWKNSMKFPRRKPFADILTWAQIAG
jgi:hypothetical protein